MLFADEFFNAFRMHIEIALNSRFLPKLNLFEGANVTLLAIKVILHLDTFGSFSLLNMPDLGIGFLLRGGSFNNS